MRDDSGAILIAHLYGVIQLKIPFDVAHLNVAGMIFAIEVSLLLTNECRGDKNMDMTKFQGDAASDVTHWQGSIAESVGDNRPLLTMSNNDVFVSQSAHAEGAIESDRASERRKWIWQMSTIVVMGISGLCLNILIKSIPRNSDIAATPIATVAFSDKDYCREGEQAYALDSNVGVKPPLTRKCTATDRVTQRDTTLNEK
ncbi:hypothetical protein ACVBEF_15335 [Glaciimonas sp. GG7]